MGSRGRFHAPLRLGKEPGKSGSEPKQHRISTGLAYPDQASESLQLMGMAPGGSPAEWAPNSSSTVGRT
jgi:hypothetical protein